MDTAHEWVELYNTSSAWIEARRWTLSDNNLTDQLAEFSLPPRGVVVLATRPLQALDGATVVIIDDGSLGNGLANTGDRLMLRDSYGNVLDALSWGNDASVFNPPCAAVAPGHSLERRFGEAAFEGCPYAEAATPSLGRLPSATPTPSATATPLAATATPSATATSLAATATPNATATPLTATAIPAAPVPPTVVLSPQARGARGGDRNRAGSRITRTVGDSHQGSSYATAPAIGATTEPAVGGTRQGDRACVCSYTGERIRNLCCASQLSCP